MPSQASTAIVAAQWLLRPSPSPHKPPLLALQKGPGTDPPSLERCKPRDGLGTEDTAWGGKQPEKRCRPQDAAGHRCWSQGTHGRPGHRQPHPLPVISLANWAHQCHDPTFCGARQPPPPPDRRAMPSPWHSRQPPRAVPGSSAIQLVTRGLPQLSVGAQLLSRLPISSIDLIKTRFHLPSTCQNEMLILICYAFDHPVVFQPRETSPR